MYLNRMKEGFSLVELVIVLILISVGLVTLLLVLQNASVNNATAHIMTVAGGLAEGKIEEILADRRNRSFAYIDNSNYPQESFDGYNIDVDIYYVDRDNLNLQTGETDYKRAEVTVSKTASDAEVVLATVVSNY